MALITTASIITLIRGMINDNLQTNGRDVFQYDSSTSFQLSQDYVSEATIKVYKNGTLLTLTTDYTYSSVTNKVTIIASLIKNDDILILYSYYAKYSDTEITNFIRVGLTQFTERQYKKYFYLNDASEVVSLNDDNPTYEEGDVIAKVTAIMIDPQNMKISIPGFTMDAPERKSRKDLIDDVFAAFTKTYGVVDFLEDDDA